MNIDIIAIPSYDKIPNDVKVFGGGIPAYDKIPNDVKVNHIGFPLSPLAITSVTIVDGFGNVIPASIIVTGAVFSDLTGLFDDMPLTFAPASMTANETGFVFGFDLGQMQLTFDMQYEIIGGRTINETFTLSTV